MFSMRSESNTIKTLSLPFLLTVVLVIRCDMLDNFSSHSPLNRFKNRVVFKTKLLTSRSVFGKGIGVIPWKLSAASVEP